MPRFIASLIFLSGLFIAPAHAASIALGQATADWVTATIEPDAADIGTPASIWLGAVYGTTLYLNDGVSWVPYTSGTLPIAKSVTLSASLSITVVDHIDISGLAGLQLYLGYGVDEQDMLTSPGKLAKIYTVDPCVNAASKWALWTGTTCLRGANVYQIHDLSSGAPGTFYPRYTQTDFNRLAALGANVVNISHPGLYSETAPYALNTGAQANLDSLLAMIQEANMFAVITFRTGPGRNEAAIVSELDFPALYSVWTSQAEQDAWVAMWKYTADRYKNNAIVVGYDLMCEPHSNAIVAIPTYEPSGFYPAYADTLYDWNPLAKRITTAIREVDADTPILIGGMSWSGAAWLDSLTSNGDSKTVYMVHQYEPQTDYTHQSAPYANTYGTSAGTFTRDNLQTYFSYISSFKSSRGVPVAVNEFGVQRYQPNADQYLTDSMDIMESNGLNYSIWLWESSDPNIDYDDFNFRRGTDPANHVDVSPNVLTTVIQKQFQKNTVRPSNRAF